MLLEPRALDSSARRIFASAMRVGMSVEEGKRRASLRARRTEKAHFAEKY